MECIWRQTPDTSRTNPWSLFLSIASSSLRCPAICDGERFSINILFFSQNILEVISSITYCLPHSWFVRMPWTSSFSHQRSHLPQLQSKRFAICTCRWNHDAKLMQQLPVHPLVYSLFFSILLHFSPGRKSAEQEESLPLPSRSRTLYLKRRSWKKLVGTTWESKGKKLQIKNKSFYKFCPL